MPAWYFWWRVRGKEPPTCLGCGGALEEHTLPVAIARTESFEVRVEGLPYRACASGCGDRRAAAPGFRDAVLAAVMQGAVPVARHDSAGQWHCARCSSREWSPVRRLSTVTGEVAVAGAVPFTMAITGPTCACGTCGTVQIRTTPVISRELRTTLDETWRAAGLRRSFR